MLSRPLSGDWRCSTRHAMISSLSAPTTERLAAGREWKEFNMPLNTDEIVRILTERGVRLPCNRCGSNKFTVIDSYSFFNLQDIPTGIRLGGTTIPVALTACENCGAITPHALGALGLLPKQEEQK